MAVTLVIFMGLNWDFWDFGWDFWDCVLVFGVVDVVWLVGAVREPPLRVWI